jgi:hypothetical protein
MPRGGRVAHAAVAAGRSCRAADVLTAAVSGPSNPRRPASRTCGSWRHDEQVSSKRRRHLPEDSLVRPDYLRALGTDFEAGLSLLVHDLTATGVMNQEQAERSVRLRAADHLRHSTENGLSIYAEETAVWVTEAIQEDIIEGLGRVRLVTWPACPDHPNHPMWLRSNDEAHASSGEPQTDPAWTCLTTKRAIAELGHL